MVAFDWHNCHWLLDAKQPYRAVPVQVKFFILGFNVYLTESDGVGALVDSLTICSVLSNAQLWRRTGC